MAEQMIVETPYERRKRISLENAIKRRARNRYRIQIGLSGPHDGTIFPACSIPFLFSTADEAWDYANEVNPMKCFPMNARSLSVEHVRLK